MLTGALTRLHVFLEVSSSISLCIAWSQWGQSGLLQASRSLRGSVPARIVAVRAKSFAVSSSSAISAIEAVLTPRGRAAPVPVAVPSPARMRWTYRDGHLSRAPLPEVGSSFSEGGSLVSAAGGGGAGFSRCEGSSRWPVSTGKCGGVTNTWSRSNLMLRSTLTDHLSGQ